MKHTLDITNMQVSASTNFYIQFLFYENGRDSKNVKKKGGMNKRLMGHNSHPKISLLIIVELDLVQILFSRLTDFISLLTSPILSPVPLTLVF